MNVFIGCSSKENLDKKYVESAKKLAEYLSFHQNHLVCGGTDGLMKVLCDIFKKNGQNTFVMSVRGYWDSVVDGVFSQTYSTTVGERKSSIFEHSNLILFLPGGIGTLDEIFSAIECKRAKEHDLPILLINIEHYYDGLLNQLDTMYESGFASLEDKKFYEVVSSVDEAIQYIEKLGEQENE